MAVLLEKAKRHRQYGQWLFFWRWGLACSALALTSWELRDQLGLASLLVGLGAGTMVAQAIPWFLERRIITRIHAALADPEYRSIALGRRSIELLPEGVKLLAPQYEALYKWPLVESIERRGFRVFVFINSFAGFAIPTSAVDADAFIAEAQRLRAGERPAE